MQHIIIVRIFIILLVNGLYFFCQSMETDNRYYISLSHLWKTRAPLFSKYKLPFFDLVGNHTLLGSEHQNNVLQKFPPLKHYLSKQYPHCLQEIAVSNQEKFVQQVSENISLDIQKNIMRYFDKELAIASFKHLKKSIYTNQNGIISLPIGNLVIKNGFVYGIDNLVAPEGFELFNQDLKEYIAEIQQSIVQAAARSLPDHLYNSENIYFSDQKEESTLKPSYYYQNSTFLYIVYYKKTQLAYFDFPYHSLVISLDKSIVILPKNGRTPISVYRPYLDIQKVKKMNLAQCIRTLNKLGVFETIAQSHTSTYSKLLPIKGKSEKGNDCPDCLIL